MNLSSLLSATQKRPRSPVGILALAFAALLLAQPGAAFAQSAGAVEGIIRSAASGEPLRNATIAVEDTALGTTTDDNGLYRLAGLPAGPHVLVARFVGFETVRQPVTVEAGETLTVNVALEEAAASLDQVVVTATRGRERLQDVPASISIVSAGEIEDKSFIYQSEPLEAVPGVSITRTGEGIYAQAQIRGVPNNHSNDTFLALVDGVPFVTAGAEVDLGALVPLEVVDRVEVVKGPVSALYGRGGISGAINYVTQSALKAPTLRASLAGGSYGYVRPSLTATLPLAENHALLVNAFYEHKNGWRDGAGRSVGSVFVKDEWLLTPSTRLETYASYYNAEQGETSYLPLRSGGSLVEVAGGEKANYGVEDARDEVEYGSATLKLDQSLGAALALSATAHYRYNRFRDVLGFNSGFSEAANEFYWTGFDGRSTERTVFVEPQLTWRFGGGRLVAGASYERKTGDDASFYTGEFGFNEATGEFLFYRQVRSYATGAFTNRDAWVTDQLLSVETAANVGGAYAQAEFDVTKRLGLTLGGRFDTFHRESRYAPLGDNPGATTEASGRRFSPKADLTYAFAPDLTVYASFGEGYSPAFGPSFAFRDRREGLDPEIARNYEAGLKGRVMGGRLAFSAAAYRLVRKDLLLVLFAESGDDAPQTLNAGEQRSQGLEVESRADLSDAVSGLSAYATYAYTDATWIDNRFVPPGSDTEVSVSGKQVAIVPAHTASAGLTQHFDRVEVTAWLDARSDYWLDQMNTVEGSGYALLNASVTYRPRLLSGVAIQVTGRNLLNTDYYHRFGGIEGARSAYPGRPFELIATLRYHF